MKPFEESLDLHRAVEAKYYLPLHGVLQDREVVFHQQCERMNAAAKWWPMLQVGRCLPDTERVRGAEKGGIQKTEPAALCMFCDRGRRWRSC